MGKIFFKIFLGLLVTAGFLGAEGLTAWAFEAHRLGVTAVIEAPESPTPSAPSCPEVEINEILTVSRASFPGKTVIIKKDSGFLPRTSNLRIDIGCDLVVEQGGFIKAGDTSGSSLRLNIGQNLRLEGEISADTPEDGGIVRISVGKDGQILGTLSASGQRDGGMVRLEVGGSLEINSSSLKVNGQEGQGGLLRLETGKTLDLKGRLETEGKEEGGMIRISALSAQISGRLSAKGTIDGGRIRLTVDKDLTVQGQSLDLSGSEGSGGSLILEAGGNVNVGGKILGNGRISGGSLSLSTSQDLEISGQIEAWASQGQGGTVSLEAPQGLLKISGHILASGETPGRINLSFCQKDFSGAVFDPEPSEEPTCAQASSNSSSFSEPENNPDSLSNPLAGESPEEPSDSPALVPDTDNEPRNIPAQEFGDSESEGDILSEGPDTSLLPPMPEISLPPPDIAPPSIPEIEEPTIVEIPEIQIPSIGVDFPPWFQ